MNLTSTYFSNIVLLVDDNEIDNIINTRMLIHSNFAKNILSHTSGKSAFELLRSLEILDMPEVVPSLIFLNLDMPIMDGLQFLKDFDSLSVDFKNKIEIVILSSTVDQKEIKQAHNHNRVVKFISKPLTLSSLKNDFVLA